MFLDFSSPGFQEYPGCTSQAVCTRDYTRVLVNDVASSVVCGW